MITDYLLSIRPTGGRQIDFKVFQATWMPRKYFKVLNSEIYRSRQFFFLTEKSKQIFSQKINKHLCLLIDYDHKLTLISQSEPQGPR